MFDDGCDMTLGQTLCTRNLKIIAGLAFTSDIAQIISRELKHMALSGVTRPETRITFPGFVMGLVQEQGVKIHGSFLEELASPIDDKYIRGKANKVSKKLTTPSTSVPPRLMTNTFRVFFFNSLAAKLHTFKV